MGGREKRLADSVRGVRVLARRGRCRRKIDQALSRRVSLGEELDMRFY